MTKRQFLRLTGFILAAVLLVCFLSWLLRERTTTFSALYSEPDQSVDVLIVGSSHVNSGYIPNMLWGSNNLSACNVFSWSQPMWTSYHYIVEALKTQSPSVIVLEAFGMTYGHSYIQPEEIDRTNYANSFNLDPSLNRLSLIRTSERCGIDLRNYEDFLDLPRYHSRWQHLNWEMISYNAHRQHDYLKGYGLLLGTTPFEDPGLPVAETPLEPYEYCVEYLDKIVSLCEKQDIRLILTLTPYIYGAEETGIYRWLDLYCAEKDIPFFNYNGQDGRRIGIDYGRDLADQGHPNYYGAVKITQDLCDYLAVTVPMPEKKDNPAYEQLQRDYARYQRIIPLNTIMDQPGLKAWLETALADENVILYVNDAGTNPEASGVLWQAVEGGAAQRYGRVEQGRLLAAPAQTLNAELFGEAGTVSFAADSAEIKLNGTAVPFGKEAAVNLVLYDKVLERPIQNVMVAEEGLELTRREFTTDILDSYK